MHTYSTHITHLTKTYDARKTIFCFNESTYGTTLRKPCDTFPAITRLLGHSVGHNTKETLSDSQDVRAAMMELILSSDNQLE